MDQRARRTKLQNRLHAWAVLILGLVSVLWVAFMSTKIAFGGPEGSLLIRFFVVYAAFGLYFLIPAPGKLTTPRWAFQLLAVIAGIGVIAMPLARKTPWSLQIELLIATSLVSGFLPSPKTKKKNSPTPSKPEAELARDPRW